MAPVLVTWPTRTGVRTSANQTPPAASAASANGASSSASENTAGVPSGATRIRRLHPESAIHIAPSDARAISRKSARSGHALGQRERRARDDALRGHVRERVLVGVRAPQRSVRPGRGHVADPLPEVEARDVRAGVRAHDREQRAEPRLPVRPDAPPARSAASSIGGRDEAALGDGAIDRVPSTALDAATHDAAVRTGHQRVDVRAHATRGRPPRGPVRQAR